MQTVYVIGEAADGATGIQMALKYQPNVALTDINMQPLDGIHTTRILLANDPSLTVIGFSALPHKHPGAANARCGGRRSHSQIGQQAGNISAHH